MIQRIQTLWLLFASACAFATFKLSFYSGHKLGDAQKQFISISGYSNTFNIYTISLTILTALAALGSLIIVFLYKDRDKQIKLTLGVLLASIISLLLYYLQTKKFVAAESSYDLTCIFAFAIPVFLFLAMRGIYKDRKLIKSVDRLR